MVIFEMIFTFHGTLAVTSSPLHSIPRDFVRNLTIHSLFLVLSSSKVSESRDLHQLFHNTTSEEPAKLKAAKLSLHNVVWFLPRPRLLRVKSLKMKNQLRRMGKRQKKLWVEKNFSERIVEIEWSLISTRVKQASRIHANTRDSEDTRGSPHVACLQISRLRVYIAASFGLHRNQRLLAVFMRLLHGNCGIHYVSGKLWFSLPYGIW